MGKISETSTSYKARFFFIFLFFQSHSRDVYFNSKIFLGIKQSPSNTLSSTAIHPHYRNMSHVKPQKLSYRALAYRQFSFLFHSSSLCIWIFCSDFLLLDIRIYSKHVKYQSRYDMEELKKKMEYFQKLISKRNIFFLVLLVCVGKLEPH